MPIEITNNNTVLKTWYLNFARPVIPVRFHLSVCFVFHTLLLALDTDLSMFTTGRAHKSVTYINTLTFFIMATF